VGFIPLKKYLGTLKECSIPGGKKRLKVKEVGGESSASLGRSRDEGVRIKERIKEAEPNH